MEMSKREKKNKNKARGHPKIVANQATVNVFYNQLVHRIRILRGKK